MNDSTLKAILEACNRTFFEFAVTVYELTDYAGNPKTYKKDHEGLFKQIRKTSLTEPSLAGKILGK